MKCYCSLRDMHYALADGQTTYHHTIQDSSQWSCQACGAEINHKFVTQKDKTRLYPIGKNMIPGIPKGHQRTEGGWTGDLLIADSQHTAHLSATDTYHQMKYGTRIPPSRRVVEREATKDNHDLWRILGDNIYCHHVAPRGQLCIFQESTFTIAQKRIDLNRRTEHTFFQFS